MFLFFGFRPPEVVTLASFLWRNDNSRCYHLPHFPELPLVPEFLLPKRSNSLGWFLTGRCLWPLLQQRPCGSSQSRGEWGGARSRLPQVTAEPRGSPDSVSTWGQRGVCGLRCVIAYLPPACGCLSEAINSSRLYFPNLFREPKFISHGKNLFILKFFSRKLLWRECNLHAYLAGREFEVQEVNSILQDHRRLVSMGFPNLASWGLAAQLSSRAAYVW